MTKQVLITKQDGTKEPFEVEKLRESLTRAGATKEEIDGVVDYVEKDLKEGMSTSEIYKHAFSYLERQEKPVAARYSLKRAIMELGPSGYPFENFIAEIFRAKGYDVKVDTIVQGACVEHEVDILAKKGGQKIGAEVKFHNRLGIRSDLKVALYVHSRFEDIRNGESTENQINEDWLITNTKFTKNAIKYAECVGLKLISWNYPKGADLHGLIEETGVQPVTALTTLSGVEKNRLLEQKVVLCKNIENNEEILHSLGLSKQKIEDVMTESQALCGI
ncbi:MAG: ATP cone domain-containing protein [Candidatus Paceibacteria bacterium]